MEGGVHMIMHRTLLLGSLWVVMGSVQAHASETITYSYDAQGRLMTVAHSGSVNANAQSAYSFDNADNRTNVTVTNAGSKVVVVPLGTGFNIIPIPDQ